MNVKLKQYLTYGLIALFVALLLVGTFYDLEIAKAVADLKERQYQSQNLFGRFFETIGEMPLYVLGGLCCSIIFSYLSKRKSTAVVIVLKIACVALALFAFYFMFYRLFKYLSIHFGFEEYLGSAVDYISYVLLGALTTGILFYYSKNNSVDFLNKILPLTFIALATALTSVILSQGIKLIFNRYRFCTLNAIDRFDLYSKWLPLKGKLPITELMSGAGVQSDGAKSFPSGHVASGSLVILITALPALFDKLNTKKARIIINASVWAYIVLLMISRMVMGKHYLTDVLIGLGITLVCYFVCTKIIYAVLKKHPVPVLKNINPIIVEEAID